MKRKEFVVFGVGDFGMYVAKTLANSGATVMVVDKDCFGSDAYNLCGCHKPGSGQTVRNWKLRRCDYRRRTEFGDQCFDYDAVKRIECAIYHGKGIH